MSDHTTIEGMAILIKQECLALEAMLLEKQKQYGNSAIHPLRIASRAPVVEQILVRIDDKLSRLARGNGDGGEDVWSDLLGYIVLLKIAKKLEATAVDRALNKPGATDAD